MAQFLEQLQERLDSLSYFFAKNDPHEREIIQKYIDREMYLEADEALEAIEGALV